MIGTNSGMMPATYQAPPENIPVEFFIPGVPAPQGSKTAFVVGKRAIVTDANREKLKPWRGIVTAHADLGVTFDCPVSVELIFIMPKPKKPRWSTPAVKPDVDKLVRAVFDGLTDAGLLADDARVVHLLATEMYTEPGEPVGVYVKVVAL